MADASGYDRVVVHKKVSPQAHQLPWPPDKSALRARHTVAVLRRLLCELQQRERLGQPPGTPLHERAVAAASAAAHVLWGRTIEREVEDAQSLLNLAWIDHRCGILSSQRRAYLFTYARSAASPWRLDKSKVTRAGWDVAIDAWIKWRTDKSGGRWAALGLLFNRDPENLKATVHKLKRERRSRAGQ